MPKGETSRPYNRDEKKASATMNRSIKSAGRILGNPSTPAGARKATLNAVSNGTVQRAAGNVLNERGMKAARRANGAAKGAGDTTGHYKNRERIGPKPKK